MANEISATQLSLNSLRKASEEKSIVDIAPRTEVSTGKLPSGDEFVQTEAGAITIAANTRNGLTLGAMLDPKKYPDHLLETVIRPSAETKQKGPQVLNISFHPVDDKDERLESKLPSHTAVLPKKLTHIQTKMTFGKLTVENLRDTVILDGVEAKGTEADPDTFIAKNSSGTAYLMRGDNLYVYDQKIDPKDSPQQLRQFEYDHDILPANAAKIKGTGEVLRIKFKANGTTDKTWVSLETYNNDLKRMYLNAPSGHELLSPKQASQL
jgi:hypothetical protein